MNSDNKSGIKHAPGVMCLIVGLEENVAHNNGKLVILQNRITNGAYYKCGCGIAGRLIFDDVLKSVTFWDVRGYGISCTKRAKATVSNMPIPQKNLIPIGDGQQLLSELVMNEFILDLASRAEGLKLKTIKPTDKVEIYKFDAL